MDAQKLHTSASCPSQKALADFSLGKVTVNDLEAIEAHLTVCPLCQATLGQFNQQTDSVVAALRNASRPESFEHAEYDRLIALVERIGHDFPGNKVEPAPEGATSTEQQELGQIGQYRLLSKLGEGGMGIVYKAAHSALDKVVAVKVLAARRTESPNAIRRFYREMKAVGKLRHPNIIGAYDAGEAGGIHYLAMELVEGLNLSLLVRLNGPLAIADACELVRQAALGLQHAHEHALVHRDLKPSNIMLSNDGSVKVLDLGLALLVIDPNAEESLTASSQMGLGTADYMSPEQAESAHHVDIRADIYSLGCTLYHLLAGHTPFSGPKFTTALQKALAQINQPIPPLGNFRPEVPRGLTTVLQRMLDKNPNNRYATPAELADALAPFAAGADLAKLASNACAAADLLSPQDIAQSTIPTSSFWQSSLDMPPPSKQRQWPRWRTWLLRAAILAAVGALLWFGAMALFPAKARGKSQISPSFTNPSCAERPASSMVSQRGIPA